MSGSAPPPAPRLGLVGGTFDPVHIGHLIMAREIVETLGLEGVRFIPASRPPHKDHGHVSATAHRVEMLRLALAHEPGFEVDLREIERGGRSYTVQTLREIRHEVGPRAALYFLIGADTLPELRTWYEAEKLFPLAHFVTAVRPGFPVDHLTALEESFAPEIVGDLRAHLVETTPIGVSSTLIRRNVLQGKSIRHLVPEAVAAYIAARRLYKAS